MPSIGQKGPCQCPFAPATQAEREPDVTFVLVVLKAKGEPQRLWCATRKFRGSAYSSSFVGGFDYCLGALQNNLNLHPRMFREIGIGHCGSSSRQGFRGGTERTVQGSLSTSRALESLSSFNRKKCYAKGTAMGCDNPSRKSLVMPTRSLQQNIEWTCS